MRGGTGLALDDGQAQGPLSSGARRWGAPCGDTSPGGQRAPPGSRPAVPGQPQVEGSTGRWDTLPDGLQDCLQRSSHRTCRPKPWNSAGRSSLKSRSGTCGFCDDLLILRRWLHHLQGINQVNSRSARLSTTAPSPGRHGSHCSVGSNTPNPASRCPSTPKRSELRSSTIQPPSAIPSLSTSAEMATTRRRWTRNQRPPLSQILTKRLCPVERERPGRQHPGID